MAHLVPQAIVEIDCSASNTITHDPDPQEETMKTIRNFSAVVAFMLLAGCSTTTDSTSPAIGTSDVSSGTAVYLSTQDLQGYELDPMVAGQVWYDATMAITPFINQYIEGDITAEKLDEMADEITDEYTDNPVVRRMVPGLVYHKTLKALLENRQGIGDVRPYIAEYTETLVDLNSPNAEDIARALIALDGYWDEAKIKIVAEKAIVASDHYLLSPTHTADNAEDAFDEQVQESKAKTNTGIGSGIQSLERLLEE